MKTKDLLSDLSNATIIDVLKQHALLRGSQVAYIFVDGNGEETEKITFGELYAETGRIALELIRCGGLPGSTVLLMYPSGLDFIKNFLGILHAGMIAVPSMVPRANEGTTRLERIIGNSQVSLVLTAEETLARIKTLDATLFDVLSRKWVKPTRLSATAEEFHPAGYDIEQAAFLQYTSGSTGNPKGVVVSHGSLMNNQKSIAAAFGHDNLSTVVVGWLPLYHDMGLIGNVLQPLYLGRPCILMSPMDFLVRPIRWLKTIEKYRATTSGGPNFSYDLCVQKIAAKDAASIDLSSWRLAFNGAEPVRANTMLGFANYFAASGFAMTSFFPCYGLAESTLFVSGAKHGNAPRVVVEGAMQSLDSKAELPAPGYEFKNYVSSGWTQNDNMVCIVDTEKSTLAKDGEIGEVWISGPAVAKGYWGQDELSERTFRCTLGEIPDRHFLRTGDLGFKNEGQEVFIVGRMKDMIIVRGVNYYAEDLEEVATKSHPILMRTRGVAFSVDSQSGEKLVILLEVPKRGVSEGDLGALAEAVSGDVSEKFGIMPAVVSFTKHGTLPVTTSGKIKRNQCRADYLDGKLQFAPRAISM